MHIFGEILFIKQQNDTQTADKRLKTTKDQQQQKREREKKRKKEERDLFGLRFCSLFGPFSPLIIIEILLKGPLCTDFASSLLYRFCRTLLYRFR